MKIISILLVSYGVFIAQKIDKSNFYEALESNSESVISEKIAALEKLNSSKDKDAYIGALTMKRAKFMKTPKEKATIFRAGRDMLENSINKAPNNAEYRFLRLIIQENSPKILKYNHDIQKDVEIINNAFHSFDTTLKRVVKNYAAESKNLSVDMLK